MNLQEYEIKLLVEAITSSLSKVKRPRGDCEKLFILPITKDIPEDFRVDTNGKHKI